MAFLTPQEPENCEPVYSPLPAKAWQAGPKGGVGSL